MTEDEILMLLLGLLAGTIATLIIAVQWTVYRPVAGLRHYLRKHQPYK